MKDIHISRRLTALRAEKGITQSDLAQALGVSNKTVSKWENGASAPDLATLAALAGYYEVSADYLLGIADQGKPDTKALLDQIFAGLDRSAFALKLFELVRYPFLPLLAAPKPTNDNPPIPEKAPDMPMNSSVLSANELYDLLICSREVNLSLILMKNQSNFGWLKDSGSLERTARLFAFLSDPDALKITAFIHRTDCSGSFTAGYMAKNTELSPEKTESLLDEAASVGLCAKNTAHLKSGEKTVYSSNGEGCILALICLAYFQMCMDKGRNIGIIGPCRMIGGEKE